MKGVHSHSHTRLEPTTSKWGSNNNSRFHFKYLYIAHKYAFSSSYYNKGGLKRDSMIFFFVRIDFLNDRFLFWQVGKKIRLLLLIEIPAFFSFVRPLRSVSVPFFISRFFFRHDHENFTLFCFPLPPILINRFWLALQFGSHQWIQSTSQD